MKNVLITGGAGFIGSNLALTLLEKGCNVTIIDNMSVSRYNVEELKAKGAKVYERDISLFSSILPLFEGIDTVFHLAAMNRAQRSIERPLDAHEANITGSLNVFEAAKQAKVNRVVNISSSSVYKDRTGASLVEGMFLEPPHPYGVGKLAAEHYARVYHELYGLNYVTLRYFSVYGPRQLGAIDKAGVIAKFIKQIENDEPLTIFGTGEQKRNFTFVGDCVNFTIKAAESDVVNEIMNVASEKEISVLELVEAIEEATGKKANIKNLPPISGDPPQNPASVEKAKELLQYSSQFDLKQGVKQTVDWYRESGKNIKL